MKRENLQVDEERLAALYGEYKGRIALWNVFDDRLQVYFPKVFVDEYAKVLGLNPKKVDPAGLWYVTNLAQYLRALPISQIEEGDGQRKDLLKFLDRKFDDLEFSWEFTEERNKKILDVHFKPEVS